MNQLAANTRRWRLKRGVRLKLTVWYGSVLIVLLVVLALLVYWLLSTNLRRELESQLEARPAQIAAALDMLESDFGIRDSLAPGELTLLYNSKGGLLHSNSRTYRPATIPIWAGSDKSGGRFAEIEINGERWLMRSANIVPSEGSESLIWIIIGRSLEPFYDTLNQMVLAIALAGPLAVLLACVGGYFLAGRALAPVAAITHTARRIQTEGLGSRIGMQERQDELGELASTFDAMLERLEDSFAREKRFTANAAHELRAPLAVVQAETSVALSKPRQGGEYRRVLSVVEDESKRMAELLNNLLILARSDEGLHNLGHTSVDLSALCAAVAAQMAARAEDKELALMADIEDGVTLTGDEIWLRQMLTNLIDNAVKYTQPGGWVKLTMTQADGQAIIRIEDNGIGVSEEHLPHIFDRFYRADKARSRNSDTAGYGLGLAICEWVAKSHGGRIEVVSMEGEGSSFRVYLATMEPSHS